MDVVPYGIEEGLLIQQKINDVQGGMLVGWKVVHQSLPQTLQLLGVKAGLAEVLPCDNAIIIVFLRALLPDQLPQAVVRPYHLTAEADVDMLFQRREVGIMAGIQLG